MGLYSPGGRTGEENFVHYPLRGPREVHGEVEPPVRVQLEALHELRLSEAALERYVGASFELQERLANSIRVLSWLSESTPRPEKLTSDDYLRRGEEWLERIDGLTEFLADHGLIDEPEFAKPAARFDEALETSMTLVRNIRNFPPEQDRSGTALELHPQLHSMNEASARMLHLCEREAGRVIEIMKKGLTRIFDRIETERQMLEMIGQQQNRIEPSGFDETKKPQDDINDTEQQRTGRKAAKPATGESQPSKPISAF